VVLDGQTSSASTVSFGSPRAPSLASCYSYSLSTTYHHQSDPPPDYLQTTVSCTEESDHQKTRLSYKRTSTAFNNGKIDGLWLSTLTCEVLRVTNKRSPMTTVYTIHVQILNTTGTAKYLGLNIHKSLSWDNHVNKITKKANSALAFLSRNISRWPTKIKAQCCTTLVRPSIEYASSVWNPSKKESINKIEAVQRRATRFTTGDYRRRGSVTSMLQQLQWQTLQCRRETAQVIMMHRIVYHLVDIPAEQHLNQSSLRTRGHHLRFLVPHTRTTVYRTSFFPQAIRLWNQLPARMVGANTLDSFTSQLSRTNTN
jgi:hypothetical protein